MRCFLPIALILVLVPCFGCHQKRSGSQMDGHLMGNVYTNAFYRFTLAVPTNWAVLNKTEIENAASRPAPPPKQVRDPGTGQMVDIPDMELYDLITLVEEPNLFPDKTLTALGSTNVSISAFGTYVLPLQDIQTSKDYLGMLVQICAIVQTPDRQLRNAGPKEVTLGGREFCHDTFRRAMKTMPVSQSIYTRVEAGYALVFVLSAPTDTKLAELEQMMATVQFH